MGSTWYDTSYRKLFFDFHSPGATVGLASAFDAERWAERLQQANAQAVSVFTKGGYGYSFYQKGTIRYKHPHLAEGLDMVEEQLHALHKRGMRAIGYYHTFNSEPIARDYPDWRKLDAEGKPVGTSICMLSPLTQKWMIPHIEEIVSLYDLDAMFFDGTYAFSTCYCAHCQRRFSEATGGLTFPKDENDPNWVRYVAWVMGAYRDVRKAICDAIHKCRPGLPISFNWVYAQLHPEAVPKHVGVLMADVFPQDQAFDSSYLARYWATLERPFDIMNSAFLQWWGDWGCKPAVAMKQEVATIIANGGLTWIGYQMDEKYDVQQAALDEMGKALAFVQEREPLLVGTRPIPNVAVLHSTDFNVTGSQPHARPDESGPRGVHRALTESMIPYHFLHEQGLAARLDDYQAVILPDGRYLAPDLLGALSDWVRAGGVLVAMGATGTLDDNYQDTGRFALEDLLGVRYEGMYEQPHAYVEVTDERLRAGTLNMAHLAEAPFVFASPIADDVEVLAKLRKIYLRSDGKFLLRWSPVGEDSGYPAITIRRVGQGWAAYVAGDVFKAYQVKNQWNLKVVMANLLRLLMPEPLVEVTAPAWVEVVLMRQDATATGGKERTLVHLVNHHGNRPVDGQNVCVEQVLPVRDIHVSLAMPIKPEKVTLEPGGELVGWSYGRGRLSVHIEELQILSTIAIV